MDTQKQIKESQKAINLLLSDKESLNRKISVQKERLLQRLTHSEEQSRQLEALRVYRQACLADGEQNIEDLTREIKGIQQDIELYSDEITGLKASIQKNENAIKGVDRQIAMVKQDMAVAKAIEAARQYNRIAEELGKVLIDLHSAISETNGRQAGGRIYKPNCELTGLFPDVCSLPKLFIKGEFECPDALKNYPENIQNHHYHTSQLS